MKIRQLVLSLICAIFIGAGVLGSDWTPRVIAQSLVPHADEDFGSHAAGGVEENVTLAAEIGGVTGGIAVQGNYAYVGETRNLVVLDITDPTRPVTVGRLPLPEWSQDMVAAENYVYIANGDRGLRIVDVSNPAAPTEVGFYDTPGFAWAVVLQGNLAYVADTTGGLRIINVETPTAPTEVGFFAPDSTIGVRDVSIAGNYAYLVHYNGVNIGGIRVVDVTDPSAPTEVEVVSPGDEYPHAITVVGNYAYFVGSRGLRVYDASDPTTLTQVGHTTAGAGDDVVVDGNYAYVGQGDAFTVIDVSTPTAPAFAGSHRLFGIGIELEKAGNLVYVATSLGGAVPVFDVTDPTTPTQVGCYCIPGDARQIAFTGSLAYVADWLSGLRILDVANPANPLPLAFQEPQVAGMAVDVDIEGDHLYLTHEAHGIGIFNLSDPTSPTFVRFYELSSGHSPMQVTTVPGYAYVVSADIFYILSLEDPEAPQEVGTYAAIVPAQADIAVAGNYVYLAGEGLRILDVSNPASPSEEGFYPGEMFSVAVAEGLAYVGMQDGLRILDVSTPSSPTEVGFFPSQDKQSFVGAVAVVGVYAYITNDGVRVLDVSTPSAPTQVGYYPAFGSDVIVASDYIYVPRSVTGVAILRFTAPVPTLIELNTFDAGAVGSTLPFSLALLMLTAGALAIYRQKQTRRAV